MLPEERLDYDKMADGADKWMQRMGLTVVGRLYEEMVDDLSGPMQDEERAWELQKWEAQVSRVMGALAKRAGWVAERKVGGASGAREPRAVQEYKSKLKEVVEAAKAVDVIVGKRGESAENTGGWVPQWVLQTIRDTPGVQEPGIGGWKKAVRQMWQVAKRMEAGMDGVVQRAEAQRYFGRVRNAWQRRGLKAMRRVVQQGTGGSVLEVPQEEAVEHFRSAGAQQGEEMTEDEMAFFKEDMPITPEVINARARMVRPLTRQEVAKVFKRRNKYKVALGHGHRLYDVAVDQDDKRRDIIDIFVVLWGEKLKLAMKGVWVAWDGEEVAAACLLWKGKEKVSKRMAIAYRIICISADLVIKEDKVWSSRCEEMCQEVGLLQLVQITRSGLVGTQMALMTMNNRVKQAEATGSNLGAVSFDVYNFYPEVRTEVQRRVMEAFHLHEAVVGMLVAWHDRCKISIVMKGIPSEEFWLPGMRQGVTSAVLCGRLVVEYIAYPVIRDNMGHFSIHEGADAVDAMTDDLIAWSGGPGMTWEQVRQDLKEMVDLIGAKFKAARLQFGASKVKAIGVAHEHGRRVWPEGGIKVETTEGMELVAWMQPGEVLDYAGGKFSFNEAEGK